MNSIFQSWEAPEDIATDDERAKWNAVFKGITSRVGPNPPQIPVADFDGAYGAIAGVRLSRDPEQWLERMPIRPDNCPVCGKVTSLSERLPASLDYTFENGVSLGMAVWVHEDCFASCTDTGEQRSVPW